MVAITISEFIYLLPILILGLAIIVSLFLIFLFRVSTRFSALFTIICLSVAFISSSFIGYKIVSNSDEQNVIQSTMQNSEPSKMKSSELPVYLQSSLLLQQPNLLTNSESSTNDDIEQDKPKSSFWKASYVTALFTSDGYSALYTSLVLFLSIMVSTLSFRWFYNDQKKSHSLFYLMLLFSALGATTLIYSSHLISLFIGIELLSIPFVGLIGYQYTQQYTLEAAIKYMVLSVIATTFLLLGIAFYYAATGELTFSGLSFQLSTLASPSLLLLLGVCLMLVGIGFKLSLVPFQLWLPDVFQGAPAGVALLLTTVGKVAIFCAVAKLFLLAPIVNNESIRTILVIMAFFSIIWGNIFAISQHNLKRLLAYSSITHFGYLLIALIAVQYQVLALETIGVYLIGYTFANICVLGVISLESQSSDKEDQDNDIDLRGLFWRKPIMALAMGVGLLSLAGVPLTVGFIGRFSLILLAVTAELWPLVAVTVLGSAFGLYFYLRLVINLYIRSNTHKQIKKQQNVKMIKSQKISINEALIVLSALFILLCGIYPRWLFSLVSVAQYLMPK
ncbi:NADH-quinone oxidoreductase subunit N [Orbus sturtevantii]|uniref:NADH-quinone oxidoreductase subunit N n=1 Tax=Orbus sturtevantii TaxID=3074109 RepID=UPI00370D52CA